MLRYEVLVSVIFDPMLDEIFLKFVFFKTAQQESEIWTNVLYL